MEFPTPDTILTHYSRLDILMSPTNDTDPFEVFPQLRVKLNIYPLLPIDESVIRLVLLPLLDDDYPEVKLSPFHHLLTKCLYFLFNFHPF